MSPEPKRPPVKAEYLEGYYDHETRCRLYLTAFPLDDRCTWVVRPAPKRLRLDTPPTVLMDDYYDHDLRCPLYLSALPPDDHCAWVIRPQPQTIWSDGARGRL